MRSSKLLNLALALSFAIASTAAAQPPAKPKAAKKPAVPAKSADKPTESAPPPQAPPPAKDVKIRTKYVNGPQVSENTTYVKGVRQRFEFPGVTLITQCDLKRSLQLHDASRHFMVMSTEPPAAPAAES